MKKLTAAEYWKARALKAEDALTEVNDILKYDAEAGCECRGCRAFLVVQDYDQELSSWETTVECEECV